MRLPADRRRLRPVAPTAQPFAQSLRRRLVDRERLPSQYHAVIGTRGGKRDELVPDIAQYHRRIALERVTPAAGTGDLVSEHRRGGSSSSISTAAGGSRARGSD